MPVTTLCRPFKVVAFVNPAVATSMRDVGDHDMADDGTDDAAYVPVRAFADLIKVVRSRTRRVEWMDHDRVVSALLVVRGPDVEAHWVRLTGSGAYRHGGVKTLHGIDLDEVEGFPTDETRDDLDRGRHLDDVLLGADSALLATFMAMVPGLGSVPHRAWREMAALAVAPSHGLLRRRLDNDAVDLLSRIGCGDDHVRAYAGDRLSHAWRRQVASRFPTYAVDLALVGMRGVLIEIDAGYNPEKALASALTAAWNASGNEGVVTVPALRRTRGITLANSDRDAATWAMTHLPPEWLPRDQVGWAALAEVVRMYRASGLPDSEAPRMLRGGVGDWPRYVRALAKGRSDRSLDRTRTDPARVRAMLDQLDRTLAEPAARTLHAGPTEAKRRMRVIRLAFGDGGFRTALSVSRAHGRAAAVVEAEMPDRYLETSWPALVADLELDGLQVVCIADGRALHQEDVRDMSMAMSRARDGIMLGLGNGARSHAAACLAGETHLLSVRDPRLGTRARLGTVAVSYGYDGLPTVVGIVGHADRRTMAVVLGAAKVVVDGIVDGSIPVNPDASKGRRAMREAPTDGSWQGDAYLAEAIRVWRQYLAKPNRHLTRERLDDLLADGRVLSPEASFGP